MINFDYFKKMNEISIIEEKTILACKFAFRVILISCVLMLSLVFSPRERETYNKAIDELNTLVNINLDDIYWTAIRESNSAGLKKLDSILNAYQYSLILGDNHIRYPEMQNRMVYAEPIPIDIKNSSLEEINSYLNKVKEIRVIHCDFDLINFGILGRNLSNNSDKKNKKIVMAIEKIHDNGKTYYQLYIKSDEWYTHETLSHKPKTRTSNIPINIMGSLRSNVGYSSLISKKDGNLIFAPNLKKIWDQIRLEKPAEARTILARIHLPNDNVVHFLGLSLAVNPLFTFFPLFMLSIFIYLHIHLEHLRRLATKSNVVFDYPWIGLISGNLAKFVSWIVLILLPLISIILVLYKIYFESNFFIFSINLLLTFISGYVSFISFGKLVEIRGLSKS